MIMVLVSLVQSRRADKATERAFEVLLRIVAWDDDANSNHVLCFTQSWNFAPTKTGTLTLTITGTLANATMSRTLMFDKMLTFGKA